MESTNKQAYETLARDKGTSLGAYVATLTTLHSQDRETIYRAAIGFANRLPLTEEDLKAKFDIALREIFIKSAHEALAA